MAGEAAVGSSPGQALTGIQAWESLPEQFGQTVAVELDLHDDHVSVRLGLKAHERLVLAIKPLAHLPELVGKIGASNADVDNPHSGPRKRCLPRQCSRPDSGELLWPKAAAKASRRARCDRFRVRPCLGRWGCPGETARTAHRTRRR